ncbi:MAG TPA: hypothetical protein VMG12_29520 [Polyangiaceae bacterium]|nr:hypothetical protein [Polyangiaceae bacterium]
MLEAIRVRIGDNTRAALGDASRQGRLPSEVARALALERLDKAVATRRWSVFAGYGNTGRDSAEPRTTREA